MKKFEYIRENNCSEDELNVFGSQGYDLVSIIQPYSIRGFMSSTTYENTDIVYVFKRKIKNKKTSLMKLSGKKS